LELIQQLQREEGTAVIMITHDLGVIANICHRVNVMYAGKFVEEATTEQLFAAPKHPYTLGLLESMPRIDEAARSRLTPIAGQPPILPHLRQGCSFRPLCCYGIEGCASQEPPLFDSPGGGRYACFVDVAHPAVKHSAAEETASG